MSNSLHDVFFYGLFMDEQLLLKKGITPLNPRKASLSNYGLRIGERASLIASENEESYGIVMSISSADLENLYSDPSVADYVSENVTVKTDQNEMIDAICYNLPLHLMSGSNSSYARSLYELSTSLDFPSHYLSQIEEFATNS